MKLNLRRFSRISKFVESFCKFIDKQYNMDSNVLLHWTSK